MTIGPNPSDYQFAINNFYVGTYYVDEPLEHNCALVWLKEEWGKSFSTLFPQIKHHIHFRYGDSARFIIGGYKRCLHLMQAVYYALIDGITFSSYKKWISLDPVQECWIPDMSNPFNIYDQRSNWTDWKNFFGNRFSNVWISANPEDAGFPKFDNDLGEYNNLLGHARNLGLSEVWLWCSNGGYNLTYIGEFCDAAWKQGWLRKFIKVREYYMWYKCIYNTPQLCAPNDPEAWEFSHKEYISTFLQEIFP